MYIVGAVEIFLVRYRNYKFFSNTWNLINAWLKTS
jgi:hypothetical protein